MPKIQFFLVQELSLPLAVSIILLITTQLLTYINDYCTTETKIYLGFQI